MAISKKIEAAFNKQFHGELAAAYAYLAMAAWCDQANFAGMAKWFKVQHEEELEHAMKFYDHVIDRGGKVAFQSLDEPKSEYKSARDVFEAALKMEQKNSKSIHELYELSLAESDYPSQPILHWFIDEQIEEEKIVGEVLATLELAKETPGALLMIDSKLASRAAG